MLSEEKSRRCLKEQIDLKVKSDNAKQVLKGRRINKRLGLRDPKLGGPTDASRGASEGMD